MDEKTTPLALLQKIPALAARFRVSLSMRKTREKVRILVVEDQLFSRKILEEVLHHEYDVDVAASAKEGMHLFLENAPDIALLDIELTDESGHMVARFIKTLDPETFVVMVTGNHAVEDVTMAKSNKVDGFIIKPYNKAKIFESIEKYFSLHPERRPTKGAIP